MDALTLPAPGRATPSAARTGSGLRALVGGGLLATAHVVLELVWGWALSTAVLVLLVLGVGLAPVLLLGLPVLALALAAAGWLGAVERARLAAVLGVVVPPPPARRPSGTGAWAAGRAVVADPARWRAVAWCLLVPLLGALWSALVLPLWSAALALATLPLWRGAAPGGGWLADTHLTTPAGAVVGVAAGVLLVPVVLVLARGCAAADVALARVLLGASRRAALAERVQQLTATRSAVVEAADAERRRIERDLHDGAQQRLVALAVDLGMASAELERAADGTVTGGAGTAAARELVARAHAGAKQALVELRDLARGIHPAVLTDRGLDAALSALAARSPVPVTVDVDLRGRCSPTVEATAYFVVAEALANAAKHARASGVTVTARRAAVPGDPPRGGERLVVTVTDDGRGGADPAAGTGLAGLGRRVAGADGTVHLSSPPGGPTELRVEIPCAS